MSDAAQIVVAVVGGSATVLAAGITTLGVVLYKRLGHIKRATDVVVDQVANDHSTNLRVEQDGRHEENSRKLDTVIRVQAEQGEQITRLVEADELHDERLDTIEKTWPRSTFAPRAKHREEIP